MITSRCNSYALDRRYVRALKQYAVNEKKSETLKSIFLLTTEHTLNKYILRQAMLTNSYQTTRHCLSTY